MKENDNNRMLCRKELQNWGFLNNLEDCGYIKSSAYMHISNIEKKHFILQSFTISN